MRSQTCKLALLSVTAVCLLTSPVSLPGQEWSAFAQGGLLSYAPAAPASTNLSLGLQYYRPSFWASLSGASPLLADSSMSWAHLSLGASPSLTKGRVQLGVEAAANGYQYRDAARGSTGHGMSLQAMPRVGVALSSVYAEARAGVSYHLLSDAGLSAEARSTLHADVSTTWQAHPALSLRSEMGILTIPIDGSYPKGSVRADFARGAMSAWASAGVLGLDTDRSWEASVGAQLEVGEEWSISAGWYRTAVDPIQWSPAQKGFSLSISRVLGRATPPSPILPLPFSGGVKIRIPRTQLNAPPRVAGDFNGWIPVGMQAEGEFWVVVISAAPGTYQFSFQSAEGEWFVPEFWPLRVEDGFGGYSAVLVID